MIHHNKKMNYCLGWLNKHLLQSEAKPVILFEAGMENKNVITKLHAKNFYQNKSDSPDERNRVSLEHIHVY